MNTRKSWAALALALMGVNAHAEIVELSLAVTATGQQTYRTNEWGGLEMTNDPTFVPQLFQWSIRFDLTEPTQYSGRTVDQKLVASTFFQNGTVAPTPYSEAMISVIPAEALLLSSGSTQIRASLTSDWWPFGVDQPVKVDTGFAGGGSLWQYISGDLAATTTYGRSFGFEGVDNAVANLDFHPWSGQEFVDYLQSKVGETQTGAFTEVLDRWVQKTTMADGEVVISSDPDAVVAHDGILITGDVTIRSITVVPEPATYLLMSLGLAVLGMTRRQAKKTFPRSVHQVRS